MALNGNVLGDLMLAAVDALSSEQAQNRQTVFRAMGAAIVTHIQTSGQVAVISVTGVLSGGSTSGPGTGTIL